MKKKSVVMMTVLVALFTILSTLAPENAAAASKYADGEYTVPFTVLKDTGNEQSTTADYMVSPAKVIIQNDKSYAVVTLKNSSWWQYFKVQTGGGFADVQVLSNDTANDKRVVKFEVKDIEQLVNAKIHIIVTGIPGFTYDNKYDIRFKFNSSNIALAPVAEKPATPPASQPTPKPVQPTPKPTPKPPVTEKASATPTEKTAEKQQVVTKVETKIEEKNEPTGIESKEVPSEKSDATAEEKAAELNEQVKDETEAESVTSNEEIIAEEQVDDSSEVTEEAIDAEVEADSSSKSSNSTWLIVIFSVLILGGVIAFAIRQQTKTEK